VSAVASLRISLRGKRREDLYSIISGVAEPEFGDNPPYLKEYVERVKESVGEPLLTDRLTGDMKKWRKFNVVYPVGFGIFIHVCSREGGTGYNSYTVIEPPKPPPSVMSAIEELLALRISSDFVPRSSEEKKRYLLYLLSEVLKPDPKASYDRLVVKGGKLLVKPGDVDYIKYYVVRDKVGVGILEPFIRDPYLEDISCSGLGNIFVIHKMFGPLESNVGFSSEEELNNFIIKLGEKIGKPISTARPVVDATLPDGSRINIVYGTDVSLRGSNFTIRRVAKSPISVTQLIDWGTFDARIAAYMWMMLNEGMSVFICGETASGKTTSLNALAVFIRPTAKIVSIEDTAEVVLPHPNWTRELTRDTGSPESSVTMFDLLRAALRQRPNYIIVGEIRGAEGNIAFQAMQSVTWETPIAVMQRGTVTVLPIGKFVDALVSSNDGYSAVPKGVKTLTLKPDGKIAWGEVAAVYRHRASKLVKIIDDEGGAVRATPSHSLFVLDLSDLTIKPAFAGALQRGDYLVKPYRPKGWLSLLSRTRGISFDESLKDGKTAKNWMRLVRGSDNGKKVPVKLLKEAYSRAGVKPPDWLQYAFQRGETGEQKYVFEQTARRALSYLRREASSSRLPAEYLERLSAIINSDIEFREVERVEADEGGEFVYDISVPGTELFLGGETPIALHNTGHPVISTFHAANLERLLQRLTNPPINIPKTNIDSLNIAWFQSAVYVKGFPSRRVIEIDEIIGYDPANNAIAAMPVFTWDPVLDKFSFAGKGSSYLLEEKLAVMRGLPKSRVSEIYDELEMRREYIQLLVDKKVFEYEKVFKAVVYASQVGIERALRELRSGSLLL